MAKVVLEFDEKGNLHSDYVGFAGMTCNNAEHRILKILEGLKIKNQSVKPKTEKQGDKVHV